MTIDENRLRHLPEPDRTEVRRLICLLGKDAFELSGPDLRYARRSAGLSLRQVANRVWPAGPEEAAIIALATLEAADKPLMDPEDADALNRLYGLKTKPL